jgi:GNAT superfamily N-acetyltransferase
MSNNAEIITINTAETATEHGFFCYKSKPKAEGYQRKLAWLDQRFAEGLQIKIIYDGNRSVGFVEYTPAEFAWRPIRADGYLAIHCLWVVGRAKKKGYGSRLLEACIEDARAMEKRGVTALTKKGGHLVGRKIFLKHGFEVVEKAAPAFSLVAKTFDDAPPPTLPKDWNARQARYGEGLTIVYANQCPYFTNAVQQTLDVAGEMDIQSRRAVKLNSAQEVQEQAPCPYGTYGIVFNGRLLSCVHLGRKRFRARLQKFLAEETT